MQIFKSKIEVETAFNTYALDGQLGEGGAGRVYSGSDSAGNSIAIKVLTNDSKEKRQRFKNEIAFLMRNKHVNIVTVTDHGIAATASIKGPFYVMQRYSHSMRDIIKKNPHPDSIMPLYSQLLDGVEAAHLQGVTHRDLKPENILIDNEKQNAAVADFGVASFTEDLVYTFVETKPTTRLANFQYAAPEQRVSGKKAGFSADIYALGLMLNELFTGSVPHGTEYKLISAITSDYGFLDPIVASMIRQNPEDRPESILEVKNMIQKYKSEAVSLQKLRELDGVVVAAEEIEDPLAHKPPRLINAYYDGRALRLELDRPVNEGWIQSFNNMGDYSAVWGVEPSKFHFDGFNQTKISVGVDANDAQRVIDHFKEWLPKASGVLRRKLEHEAKVQEAYRIDQLKREREAEQLRLKVNRSLRI